VKGQRLHIEIGVVKTRKYATNESGDTIEIIERPRGGVSVVLVDGQRSGRSAKIISNIVARKAISLLGEGVRDGAAARAAHDYLRTHRGGQVSAELQILSVDLDTGTLVLSRNTHCPALIARQGECFVWDTPSVAIGIYPNTKPLIRELTLEPGMVVGLFTDGLLRERRFELDALQTCVEEGLRLGLGAQELAEVVFNRSLRAQEQRPQDDISVVTLLVRSAVPVLEVRKLSASISA